MKLSAVRHETAMLCVLLTLATGEAVHAQYGKALLGKPMEPFTLLKLDGGQYTYEQLHGHLTMLAFMTAHQKRSERAMNDLVELSLELRREDQPVELLFVISGGGGIEYFRRRQEELGPDVTLLIDGEDVLWGRLGVVVTPTTMLVDENGIIQWVRAGHGYDFATDARASMDLIRGIRAPAGGGEDVGSLPSSAAESVEIRAKRHVRMGRVLAKRGQIDAGLAELRRAEAITPDSIAVLLELAHLLFEAGQPEEALAVLTRVQPTTTEQRARLKMLEGWGRRLLGDLNRARTLLAESLAIDPASGRALFELGQVYEQRGDCESAMEAYRRALALQYNRALSSQ